MKIYISVDIEGVAGICDWKEASKSGDDYKIYRDEMAKETLACVEAIQKHGNHEIYIRDAHGSARNLHLSDFPKGVKLIRGWEEHPCDMLAGLDSSFDACIFIGYHSPSRSANNPLSHTLSLSLNHIKINDEIVSEFELNAYYAQSLNVPVIMVSGDEGLADRVREANDNIEIVSTNKGMHGAILAKHPDDVVKEIKEATIKALQKLAGMDKYNYHIIVPRRMEVELHFKKHSQAHYASFYPGVTQLSDDKVLFSANNILDLLTFIMFVIK